MGTSLGDKDGILDGESLGRMLGIKDGMSDGELLGLCVGDSVAQGPKPYTPQVALQISKIFLPSRTVL